MFIYKLHICYFLKIFTIKDILKDENLMEFNEQNKLINKTETDA